MQKARGLHTQACKRRKEKGLTFLCEEEAPTMRGYNKIDIVMYLSSFL